MLKYLAGEIQPAENQKLQAWLDAHEDHRKLFQAIQSNWNASASGSQKAATAYPQLAHRLGLQEEPISPDQPQSTRKIRKSITFWLRVAASFTGLLMMATITYYFLSDTDASLHTTGYGETATIILPDRSVVTLNANSSLEYITHWGQQTPREVWLEGEAFFHVRKIEQNEVTTLPSRFVVHTSQVDVEVLGTQFNVNERHGRTTVVLNSGKVKLNSHLSQDEELVMAPGEYVELSAANKQFIKRVVDPEIYSSWKDKKLILDNTTLREIARIIEDYYGLEVMFEDAGVAEKALTGSIPTNDLDTFLTVLSASIDVQVKREGNTLMIKNKESP